jgi:hypothetical protein
MEHPPYGPDWPSILSAVRRYPTNCTTSGTLAGLTDGPAAFPMASDVSMRSVGGRGPGSPPAIGRLECS